MTCETAHRRTARRVEGEGGQVQAARLHVRTRPTCDLGSSRHRGRGRRLVRDGSRAVLGRRTEARASHSTPRWLLDLRRGIQRYTCFSGADRGCGAVDCRATVATALDSSSSGATLVFGPDAAHRDSASHGEVGLSEAETTGAELFGLSSEWPGPEASFDVAVAADGWRDEVSQAATRLQTPDRRR
jgi:hypothetical protein